MRAALAIAVALRRTCVAVLARRATRERELGGFDVAGDRAVWAVGTSAGHMRIELQRL